MMKSGVFYMFWVKKRVGENPRKSQIRMSWGWSKPNLLYTKIEMTALDPWDTCQGFSTPQAQTQLYSDYYPLI